MTTLRLPELAELPSLGGQLVARAIGLTLAGLSTLAALTLVALFHIDTEITIDAAGVLEPETVWRVYSPVSAIAHEIAVESGETVGPGQRLASLDGYALEQRLERLRLEEKMQSFGAPRSDRSERALLKQSIQTTQQDLARYVVRSPGAGRVLTEELDKLRGAWIAEGTLLFEVGSTDRWQATILVTERDIHRIRLGDPVKIDIPALTPLESWTDEPLPGEVTFVGSDPFPGAQLASGRPQRVTYRVQAALNAQRITPQQLASFKRGMSLNGQIITRTGRVIDLLVHYFRQRVEV